MRHGMSRRLAALVVAAAAAAAVLLAGGAEASDRDQPITRAEIMRRAMVWVNAKVPYSQSRSYGENAPGGKNYRTDCSGFTSLAWKLSGSETTRTLEGKACYRINWQDMQPGDAYLRPGGHVFIFESWATESRSHVIALEEKGTAWGTIRGRRKRPSASSGYFPCRYKRVVGGGPAPVLGPMPAATPAAASSPAARAAFPSSASLPASVGSLGGVASRSVPLAGAGHALPSSAGNTIWTAPHLGNNEGAPDPRKELTEPPFVGADSPVRVQDLPPGSAAAGDGATAAQRQTDGLPPGPAAPPTGVFGGLRP